jgi:hypothetical protein
MKKTILFLSISIFIFTTACANQDTQNDLNTSSQNSDLETETSNNTEETNTNNENDNINNNTDNTEETNTNNENDNTNNNTDNSTTEKSYYGNWTIESFITSGSVSTYGEDEISQVLGREFIIKEDECTNFGDSPSYVNETIESPIYKELDFNGLEFEEYFNISPTLIGLDTDNLGVMQVYENDSNKFNFFIVTSDMLILNGGGAYFKLTRIN